MADDEKNRTVSASGIAAPALAGADPLATAACLVVDLGFIDYREALELQKRIVAARKADRIDDVLLLCQHPHVITQGRSGRPEHLLASERVLRQKGIAYYETHRGGDITYHGPGQVVGYPIVHLGGIRRDVGWYVRMLEEAMIRATRAFGIAAVRETGKTGVWVSAAAQSASIPAAEDLRAAAPSEKLGAIGVHISRWVTSHGFAYNVSTDLRYFDLIVPCGIAGRKATSLEKLLERTVAAEELTPLLAGELCAVLGRRPLAQSPAELYDLLGQAESGSPGAREAQPGAHCQSIATTEHA